jgi:hypothetical protein
MEVQNLRRINEVLRGEDLQRSAKKYALVYVDAERRMKCSVGTMPQVPIFG